MPFNPLFLKDVDFTVAAVDYAAELASVLFDTDTSQVTWRGLKPTSSFSQSTPPTFAATIRYAQDWDNPASFARFLYDNDGETVVATFTPRSGSAPEFTTNLQIVSGPIGGDVDAYAESTVTLGCDRPVLSAVDPE